MAQALAALQANREAGYPGLATMLRVLSRLVPEFLLKQLGNGWRESPARG